MAIEASLLRALHASVSEWPDANNRCFRMIDLTSGKSRLCISISPAEGSFCLTNGYVEVAIIIVFAYEDRPVLDSRASVELEALPEAL